MKLKKPTSKVLGELTGKLVAGAVALPGKTSDTTGSIKAEFLAGYKATNSSSKKMEETPDESVNPFEVFSDRK
jgi:hypothetical protein